MKNVPGFKDAKSEAEMTCTTITVLHLHIILHEIVISLSSYNIICILQIGKWEKDIIV